MDKKLAIPVKWHDAGDNVHRLEVIVHNQAKVLESVSLTKTGGTYWIIKGKISTDTYRTLEKAKKAVEEILGVVRITEPEVKLT